MKRTSLVINNSIRKDAPAVLSSKGLQAAMQFYCNVLMFGCSEGVDFYPAGETCGIEDEFFTIGTGKSYALLHAFSACSRIATEIRLQGYLSGALPSVAISIQFFDAESAEFFYRLTVGFSIAEGEYCFSSRL